MSEEDFFEEFDKLQDETPLIPNIIGGGSIVVSQSEDSIVITDGNTSGSEGGNGGDAGDGSDGSDGSNGGNGGNGGGGLHTHENVGSGAELVKGDVDPDTGVGIVEIRSISGDEDEYLFPDTSRDQLPVEIEAIEDGDEVKISGYADPQQLFHPTAAAPLLREASVVVSPGIADDDNNALAGAVDLPIKIARGVNGLKAQDSGTDAFEITPDLAYWKFSIFKVGDTGNPSVNIASSSVFSGYDPDVYPTYGIRFPVTNNKISGGHTIVNTVNPYTGTGVDQTFCTIPVCLLGQIYVWGGAYQESIIAVDGKPVTVLNKI